METFFHWYVTTLVPVFVILNTALASWQEVKPTGLVNTVTFTVLVFVVKQELTKPNWQ